MKYWTTIILTVITLAVSAQDTLKLKIDNPTPRVGDKVALSINNDFFVDMLKSQQKPGIVSYPDLSSGVNSGEMKWLVKFENTGQQVLGPYKFEINGKSYITNSIVVNVADKLPWQEGVWGRFEHVDGVDYLILEQLISDKNDLDKNYAELNETMHKAARINTVYSLNHSPSFEDGKTEGPKYRYVMHRYKVEFDKNFEGTFYLNKKDFKNLPSSGIDKIEIKK